MAELPDKAARRDLRGGTPVMAFPTATWLSRYRRLNTVFDRQPDLFAAHVWIAMISIIARRLASLETQQAQGV